VTSAMTEQTSEGVVRAWLFLYLAKRAASDIVRAMWLVVTSKQIEVALLHRNGDDTSSVEEIRREIDDMEVQLGTDLMGKARERLRTTRVWPTESSFEPLRRVGSGQYRERERVAILITAVSNLVDSLNETTKQEPAVGARKAATERGSVRRRPLARSPSRALRQATL
jgi:hypothetical protein